MKFFQKDLRKEYLKMTGIKYGKEEEKEIKSMLKSEMPLEIFKLCVTPIVDERKLKEIMKRSSSGREKYISTVFHPMR